MARFSVIYHLFAVLVVLAVVANARPTTPTSSDLGSVAGIPGMASTLKQGGAQDPSQDKSVNIDTTMDEDIAEAMEAVAAAV
jgi:hypothetical protein